MSELLDIDSLHHLAATGNAMGAPSGNGSSAAYVSSSSFGDYMEGAIEAVASLPQFVAASVASGGAGLWNTGVAVANAFGADVEEANTYDLLTKLDDDLGQYYLDHKAGADIAGFIAGSILPGMGAVRILERGQAGLRAMQAAGNGRLGALGSSLTKVLAPDVATYSYAAKARIAAGVDSANFLNMSTLKAIGSAAQQAALETAVFEVAATATAFNGEVLKDKEVSDLATDMAFNVLLGAGVGAAFGSVSQYYKGKHAAEAVDRTKQGLFSRQHYEGITPGTQAVDFRDRLSKVPGEFTAEDILLGKVASLTKDFPPVNAIGDATAVQVKAAEELAASVNATRATHIAELNNEYRKSITAMTGGDGDLARHLADVTTATDSKVHVFLNARELSRVGDVKRLAPEAVEAGERVSYVIVHGDGMGQMLEGDPLKWRVADMFKGEKLDKYLKSGSKFASAKAGAADLSKFNTYSELEIDARFLRFERMKPGKEDFTKSAFHWSDVPALKAAIRMDQEITVKGLDGAETMLITQGDRIAFLRDSVDNLIVSGVKQGLTPASLAHRLDVPLEYIAGQRSGNLSQDLFAANQANAKHTELMKAAGNYRGGAGDINLREVPKYAAVHTDPVLVEGSKQFLDSSGFVTDALAVVASRVKVAEEVAMRNVIMAHPEYRDIFMDMPDKLQTELMTRYSGSGVLTSAGTKLYGPVAHAEYIGQQVKKMMAMEVDDFTKRSAPAFAELEKNPVIAAKFATLDAQVSRAGEAFVYLDDEGVLVARRLLEGAEARAANSLKAELTQRLKGKYASAEELKDAVAKELDNAREALKQEALDTFREEASEFIPVRAGTKPIIEIERDISAVVRAHMDESSRYTAKQELLDRARNIDPGDKWAKRGEEYYSIPRNPKDYKFFAFVEDTALASKANSATTMIHAATEHELRAMMAKAKQIEKVEVHTGPGAERYWDSIKQHEHAKTLHESRVNGELERAGVSSDFFVQTSGANISQRLSEFHVGRRHAQIRAGVEAKYANDFETLRNYGQSITDAALSRKGGASKGLEATVQNPYGDVIKTALNLSKFSEYGWWHQPDQLLNEQVGKLMTKFSAGKIRNQEELDAVAEELSKAGFNTAYKDAATYALADHKAGRAPVTALIQAANSITATFALRFDMLNAVVNNIGGTLSRSSEMRFVLRALERGDANVVGPDLAKLAHIDIDGVKSLNFLKMQKDAWSELAGMGTKHPWYKEFVEKGWINTDVAAQHNLRDMLSPTADMSAAEMLKSKDAAFALWHKVSEGGAKWTGNTLAEGSNRFVSAYVAKQVAELAQKHGVMGAKEADSFITAIVNRCEGTLVASQKPILFNGAIGGAMGLFQSYQFRLAQQMLRFVGEGTKQDMAMFLGLQGTLFGANSLPGFQAMNEHIIGTMSSNPEHITAYDAAYSGLGRKGADLLMYGIPSNLLQNNLYTRGDINPRHPLILPTSIADVPAVGMISKAWKAGAAMVAEGAETGNVGHAILTGLEHNGINRPIAGISMLAKAVAYQGSNVVLRTGKDTDLVTSNILDLAQVSRLAGGRPMAEAVLTEEYYRMQAFSRRDTEKRAELSQKIRLELQAGTLTQESLDDYVGDFVKTGKKQQDFAKWSMSIIKKATEKDKGVIPTMLGTQYGRTMQVMMGGQDSSRVQRAVVSEAEAAQ